MLFALSVFQLRAPCNGRRLTGRETTLSVRSGQKSGLPIRFDAHLCRDPTRLQIVYTFSLKYTNALPPRDAFEHVHLVAALGGLVNRDGPQYARKPLKTASPRSLLFGRLFVDYMDADATWLSYMKQSWLSQVTFANLTSLQQLLATFAPFYSGAGANSIFALIRIRLSETVVYDPDVAATSNVASTVAGVDRLLPFCFRTDGWAFPALPFIDARRCSQSLYSQFVAGGPKLPVRVNLVGKFDGKVTGSKKTCSCFLPVKQI